MNRSFLQRFSLGVLLALYGIYLAYLLRAPRGPVDFETFRDIGQRFLNGEAVYGPNSYYPLPYVFIFAALAALPRAVSILLWFGVPLLGTLSIVGWRPWVLLFAPFGAHFVGGQSAFAGLLGFWGYRRYRGRARGGAYLALTSLKPQLGIVPLGFALWQWGRDFQRTRRLTRQALVWFGTMLVLWLPSFVLWPTWPLAWLQHPRPLFPRAMIGLVPRLAWPVLPRSPLLYGVIVGGSALLVLALLWRKRALNLDTWMLWWFTSSPLVHDYDLIQLIPILDTAPRLRRVALLLSIPAWWVIFVSYGHDEAWLLYALFAPVLLATSILARISVNKKEEGRA